jgi:plasmid stabilization system protein ParE
VRRHVVGNYLIYYWTVIDGVEILRVVHAAREQGQAI